MEKSTLQRRAESLAERFRASRSPALVVEFAGLPKAGKTTTLNQVYAFLRRCGFRCEVVVERASVCPIRDKKHFNFNIWTACTSLSHLLDKTQNPPRQDDPDILFLDRGIFDSVCWFTVLERLARVTSEIRTRVEGFLLLEDWTKRISGVVVMTASPEDALKREQGHLPFQGSGGSIMNLPVLRQIKSMIEDNTKRLKDQFRIFEIDTSSATYSHKQGATCEATTNKILDWVEEAVEENILSVPRGALPQLSDRFVTTSDGARSLIEKIESQGDFLPRTKVEADSDRVQPLPVVVVRNRSGKILRLVRKERESSNQLHRKMTVWAGGHVRREDGSTGGGAIFAGARRELREELRLFVEPEKLILLGAVYLASGESTKKHLALVYEWTAESDDVEVALCNSEFAEKAGTSLSGTFVAPEKAMEEAERGEISEVWSVEILKNLIKPVIPRPVVA